jgi:hypothetical protein
LKSNPLWLLQVDPSALQLLTLDHFCWAPVAHKVWQTSERWLFCW